MLNFSMFHDTKITIKTNFYLSEVINITCKECLKRGKTWDGSDPKCAFIEEYQDGRISTLEYCGEEDKITTKKFSKDNWNCSTMNKLRCIIKEDGWFYRNDLSTASIGVLPFETENYTGNLILTWYKDRGATGNAVIMWDDENTRILTEDIAEEIIKKYWKELI